MPAATGNFVLDKGYRAAAAITKRRAVKFSAAETVTPVTALGDTIAGFALFSVAAGEITKGKGCTVRQQGIVEAEASAAIAIGAVVELIADGRVRTATASSAARIVGRCVGSPATNAGDVISLEVDISAGLVGATF
jgi:predicted RecA/RadA family phage recombinase